MKVLIVDRPAAKTVAGLERLGLQVEVDSQLKAESLAKADILIVRTTGLSAATVRAARRLSLVIAAGPDISGIDVAASSGMGVYVAHCPSEDTVDVIQSVELYMKTGHPAGTVNLCARSPAKYRLVVRHLNRVGVLAFVLDGLREENVNVEEMENTIFAGAEAGCCSMLLDQAPSESLLEFFRGNPSILHATLNRCE
ncbi:MAG: hypothetical protein ABFC63_09580 [Thermoguttaceae bacterium]